MAVSVWLQNNVTFLHINVCVVASCHVSLCAMFLSFAVLLWSCSALSGISVGVGCKVHVQRDDDSLRTDLFWVRFHSEKLFKFCNFVI